MRPALGVAFACALLASGCFGMCGLSPESADWNDPGLFAAMPPPGTPGATWTDPVPGLPFARQVDPAWGPHNLSAVAFSAGDPGDTTEVRVAIAPDSGLTATRENTTPEAHVAAAVRTFLANTTTFDEAGREAVVAALLRNATAGADYHYGGDGTNVLTRHTVTYQAALPDRLRLEGFYGDLERLGVLQVGLGGASAGPWTFAFSLAQRSLEADGGGLQVGPTGEARFEGFGRGERSVQSYRADVRAWLTAHGLPAPAEMHVGGSIC